MIQLAILDQKKIHSAIIIFQIERFSQKFVIPVDPAIVEPVWVVLRETIHTLKRAGKLIKASTFVAAQGAFPDGDQPRLRTFTSLAIVDFVGPLLNVKVLETKVLPAFVFEIFLVSLFGESQGCSPALFDFPVCLGALRPQLSHLVDPVLHNFPVHVSELFWRKLTKELVQIILKVCQLFYGVCNGMSSELSFVHGSYWLFLLHLSQ